MARPSREDRAEAEQLLGGLSELVDRLITAGRYSGALAAAERLPQDSRRQLRQLAPERDALLEINLAEAEYNQGALEAARERLVRVEQRALRTPFSRAAWHCQWAWLAARMGDALVALEAVEAVEFDELPQRYWAERAYTRALALAGVGALPAAVEHARFGVALAARPSSERNGQFLLGMLYAIGDDPAQARAHFEAGLTHRYRHQGGDALLVYAELCAAEDDASGERRVLELIVERDRESGAAELARRRLGALAL